MASKDKAASEGAKALVRKRWSKTTKKERSELSSVMSNQRWANATPEERAAQGKRLAEARAKARAERKAGRA